MTQTTIKPAIDRAAIDELSRGNSDPDWVKSARLKAVELYESLPLPTERSEGWRRTSLAGIDLTPPSPSPSRATVTHGNKIERASGDLVSDEITEATNRHMGDWMAIVNAGRSTGKFSALAQAVWQGGRYLDIGPNVTLSEPIVVEWDDGPYPRLVVYVAPNARASIVERHTAVDRFRSGVVDIYLDEGAHLTYVHVQNAPRDAVV